MKKLMIFGGLIGFLLGLSLGMTAQGRNVPSLFLQASVTALGGGLLLRWWGAQCQRNLAKAVFERRQAASRAAAKPNSNARP
ncbi:MAG: hypothetical protein AB1705_04570 [Verrucomicrobiota bacterium]